MKKPSDNSLFLSPTGPLLAALFLTIPVAFALQENLPALDYSSFLALPVPPEEALPVVIAVLLLFLLALIRATQALSRLRARAALAGFPVQFLSSVRLFRLVKHLSLIHI